MWSVPDTQLHLGEAYSSFSTGFDEGAEGAAFFGGLKDLWTRRHHRRSRQCIVLRRQTTAPQDDITSGMQTVCEAARGEGSSTLLGWQSLCTMRLGLGSGLLAGLGFWSRCSACGGLL